MMAKTRGHPPIPVRADPVFVDTWKVAAKRAGMSLSDWVRGTLNRAADPEAPAKLQAKAKQALAGLQATGADSAIMTGKQAKAEANRQLARHRQMGVDLPPVPRPEGEPRIHDRRLSDPGTCSHPKDQQRVMPYGRICNRCGRKVT